MRSSDPRPGGDFASERPAPARSAGATSPHTRFIPREELRGFAAWAPGDLQQPARPARRAEDSAPDAAARAAAVAEEVRAARQSGYQDGYRDGLVALEGFKQSYAQQTTRQIGQLVQSVGDELDRLQQDLADAVAATALQLARQLVRHELSARPELVAVVARDAVEALVAGARHVTLRVHADDLPLVAAGAAEVLEARGARLVADPAVRRGGCVVESDGGRVDARVEARWAQAAAAIGQSQPWTDDGATP